MGAPDLSGPYSGKLWMCFFSSSAASTMSCAALFAPCPALAWNTISKTSFGIK